LRAADTPRRNRSASPSVLADRLPPRGYGFVVPSGDGVDFRLGIAVAVGVAVAFVEGFGVGFAVGLGVGDGAAGGVVAAAGSIGTVSDQV